jgi:hypothetical protein
MEHGSFKIKILRVYPRGPHTSWAYSDAFVDLFVSTQFPRQDSNLSQRRRADLCRRLIHLYYRTPTTSVLEIAAEFGMSKKAVECHIARLKKKAEKMIEAKHLESAYYEAPPVHEKSGRVLVAAGQVVTAEPYDLKRLLALPDAEDASGAVRKQAEAALDGAPEKLLAA